MNYENRSVFVREFLNETGFGFRYHRADRLIEAMYAEQQSLLWVDFGDFRVSVTFRMEDDGQETKRWCLMFTSSTEIRVVEGIFIEADSHSQMELQTKNFRMFPSRKEEN